MNAADSNTLPLSVRSGKSSFREGKDHGYMLFDSENRPRIKMSGIKLASEQAKVLGAEWRKLPARIRQEYRQRAEAERIKFKPIQPENSIQQSKSTLKTKRPTLSRKILLPSNDQWDKLEQNSQTTFVASMDIGSARFPSTNESLNTNENETLEIENRKE